MIRVYIVDDHALIREGIKRIVAATDDIEIAGEAENGDRLIRDVANKKLEIDIILLDISLPGRDGLELLKVVKAARPGIKVLILSILPEKEFAIRALKIGASGFIPKEKTPADLITAIHTVYSGHKYISTAVAEQLLDQIESGSPDHLHDLLSDREFQVLILIARGKTVSEIARELFLSVKTISNFRSRILKKMDMNTTAQLIHYAIEHDLIP